MSSGSDPKKDHGVLYLGIDLGTSRTSVSASNGLRETVASFVGYPKDVVSRKLLKKDVLFGSEAVEHRLSLNFFRPLQHGVLKSNDDGAANQDNLGAAKDLISEIIRRAKPRKDELIYAVIGAPAQASINNKEAIIEAARQSVDSVMLCSEPFAVAYGLDMLDDVLVIDIGAGTVDLCRMHGTMPDENDQVTIDHAGDRIDSILEDLVRKAHPTVQFSRQMITDAKEKFATVDDSQGRVMVRWPVNGKPTDVDITKQMIEACHSIVPPIVEALGRLVASFDPEFQAKLRNNVILGGGGSQIRGLGDAISAYMDEHLGGGKVVHVEEPVYAGANGTLKIAKDMPPEFWEQLR